MRTLPSVTGLLLAALAPLLLAACSDSPNDDNVLTSDRSILRYVPADTPYVFAAAEPVPDELRDKFAPQIEELIEAYRGLLQVTLGQYADEGQGSAQEHEAAFAMIEEVAAMVTPDGIPGAGIDRDSTAAIYGVGMLPVLRITLSDGALFEATVEKLEKQAGETMSAGNIDGHDYRYVNDDDGRFVVAVIDNQLVVSVVPLELSQEHMKSVLGIDLPQKSIAESGSLAALADEYDYTPYGLGILDFERLAAVFLGDTAGMESEVLRLMGYDASSFTDVCKAELRSVAAVAPRLHSGYTEISTRQLRLNTVIELREDLAAGLKGLTAPVPGLGVGQDALIAFGMGFNLLAAREFYSARLEALEADPYTCELLATLQDGVKGARAVLDQPVPPIVYSFRGFLAVIDDITGFDFRRRQPPTDVDMRLLVATENAQALLAVGMMFSPEIAALNLQPDSKPVRLAIPAFASSVDTGWIAMSDNALAISIGNGSETRLEAMLSSPAAEPPPLFSMNLDAGRYYGFMGDAMRFGSDDADSASQVSLATSDLMKSFEKMVSKIAFDIQFTDRGVEMPSTVELAQ